MRERGASGASPTFPKIAIDAGCCSTSPSTKTPFSACTTGPPVTSGVMMDEREVRRRTADIITRFDVRPPNPALPARALSGGNQQKLIIGREFELKPKLLLVAQPTRGVDIGAIEFIHRKLVALRDAGCAVLLVSAELEEVMSLSDRLLVIHGGRIAGEVDPAIATPEDVGILMAGAGAPNAAAALGWLG